MDSAAVEHVNALHATNRLGTPEGVANAVVS
jgi:hypothetical protein